jgi:hypothetical protein
MKNVSVIVKNHLNEELENIKETSIRKYPIISAMTYNQFLGYLKNVNKSKQIECAISIEPEFPLSQVLNNKVTVYFDENNIWNSIDNDGDDMPVVSWTLGDDDIIYILDIK